MITFDELEKCPPSHPVFFLRILLPPSQLLESTTSVSTRKFLESYMHVHPDLIEELMIFFKALLFYLPRCLWKSFEGGLMETFGRYCSFCPRPRVLYFCTQFLPLCIFCSRSTVIGIFTLLLLPIKSFMTFFDMSVKPKRSLFLAEETRWRGNKS